MASMLKHFLKFAFYQRLCSDLLKNFYNVLTAVPHVGLQLHLQFAINDGLLGFYVCGRALKVVMTDE
jgi:hypothetical protein